MATILLFRHGETSWNRDRRAQGWAPIGLTDRGRRHSRAAGEAIATQYDVDRIVTSDLRRAIETVRELRRSLDVPFERDPTWRERDFGELQGLEYEMAFHTHPEFSLFESGHWAIDATPEGGESWLDLDERIRSGVADLLERIGEDETVLVVSHGGPLQVVLGAVEGLDAVESLAEHDLGNCALIDLAVDQSGQGDRGTLDRSGVADGGTDGRPASEDGGTADRRAAIGTVLTLQREPTVVGDPDA